MPEKPERPQRAFSQAEAAAYLGVGVTWFRQHVHVKPIPFGPVTSEARPMLRYLREDLDAWVDRQKTHRRAG